MTCHAFQPGRARGLAALAIVFLAACGQLAAQDDGADISRLVERLEVTPGMRIAEIGAGAGGLTVALAREVGPSGHVYSNELSADRRSAIRAAVSRAGLANVSVVEGHSSDTGRAKECCVAIFIRNVYHHFDDPGAMNASLWRSLRSGGRLAIIDFPPRGGREAAGPGGRGRGARHGVAAATVAQELRDAGFEILLTDESVGRRAFMVLGRKP